MRAFSTTIVRSRPGTRASAMNAPHGRPDGAGPASADRLTTSDRRTIVSSAGSPERISSMAEASCGMAASPGMRVMFDLLHLAQPWSNIVISSFECMSMQGPELLTTEEAAAYLRLSERKLYELVARSEVRCTKITGKWLFRKAALSRWLAASLIMPGAARTPAPPIVGGSHDPLLEWALRESGSRLASLLEGSETGLARLRLGEVVAAAGPLHSLHWDHAGAQPGGGWGAPGVP